MNEQPTASEYRSTPGTPLRLRDGGQSAPDHPAETRVLVAHRPFLAVAIAVSAGYLLGRTIAKVW